MSAPKAIIYTKEACRNCQLAKELLQTITSNVITHPLPDVAALQSLLGERATAFPQIFLGGNHIGGYTQLKERLQEPLLMDNPNRFTPFPIQYPDIWDLYKKAVSSFWPVEEVKLNKDYDDWVKLSPNEQYFIRHVLAFFASADGIIQENLAAAFATEVTIPEARQFFSFQIFNESQHSEQYSLLIDTLIRDPVEKEHLFKSIQTIPCVQKKAQWAMKWLDRSKPFPARLFAFACVEGVQFSGSFAAIFWLKSRGVMPGLCTSNEFISRDEASHLEHGVALYKHLKTKLSQQEAEDILSDAVDHEVEFLTDALPCSLMGINCDAMTKYIKHVADRLLKQIGYHPMYNVTHDLDFMELISLQGKANFFETVESNYNKHGMLTKQEDNVFALDEEF